MEAKEVCSWFDSALDREAMATDTDWIRTRLASAAVAAEGKTLTRFTVRPLTRSEMKWVKQGADEAEKQERAFRVAVVKITDIVFRDGSKANLFQPSGDIVIGTGRIRAVSESEMDRMPDAYIEDIGMVAFTMGFLPPGSELRFPLPRLWLLALSAAPSPRADAEGSIRSETGGNGKPKAPPPQSSLPPGGLPGVAPAEMATTGEE